ncbi:BTAD domain-containing putative transcriptional regulator [Streptomyces sp. NPDC020996]|uniref:AfsR/SARP family transcriptional regulator n=1 Tax=Streptomyces sp. NPDC020996 TaxID=3154791 RepID=UPI0033CF9CB4
MDTWIGVLGSTTATVAGRQVSLGGLRQRAVLAVLVAARGRVVPADTLLAEAWDGMRRPSTSALHSYVRDLRKALEPERTARQAATVLVREGTGYALRLGAAGIDAERFTERTSQGQQSLRAGDAAGAARALREAVGLWRGPAYADFADASFAVPEAVRLEALRLAAYEDLYAAELALGRHASVVGDLGAYTAEHPLSERGWELLALALYRSGRQGDALGALRTARHTLAEELGVDPGPGLRELEAALLAQDDSVAAVVGRTQDGGLATLVTGAARGVSHSPGDGDKAEGGEARSRTGNVPLSLAKSVGRDEELAAVRQLSAAHRLVTLTGPGGVGKTWLALEVARAHADADGPWLVELASLNDPALLPGSIAQVLGIRADTAERLAEVLADRELLLVVDNCEHLLAAAAEVVVRLLTHCGGLRVLATSREPLGVTGEVVHEVPRLSAQQATELFLERATARVPGWEPSRDELDVVGRICAELDRLPLAIELAAGQSRILSVEQISAALDDRFAVLVGGAASGPERHRGLQEAVAWSHRLLEPEERQLFHRLSVFAGCFDLDAVTAVCGRPVIAPLASLVHKSLVAVEPGSTPRRYQLLETLKEFGRVHAEPTQWAAAQEAHRAWVLARAEAAEGRLRGEDALTAQRQLTRDVPEIRSAFNSALLAGDGEYALRLAGALSMYWYRQGHVAEGLGWLAAALDLSPGAGPGLRARALVGQGGLLYLAGDFVGAARAMHAAARDARAAQDLVTEGVALTYRALFGGLAGEPEAAANAQAAVELARCTGERWLEAEALMGLGMLLRLAGRAGAAHEALERAVRVAHSCGHRLVEASSTWLGMKTDIDLGRPQAAVQAGLSVLRVLDKDGDVTSWLVVAHTTAAALALTGDAPRGATLLGVVEERGAKVGFSPAAMDPLDAPGQTDRVRRALSPEDFEHRFALGRQLTDDQVRVLLAQYQPEPQ